MGYRPRCRAPLSLPEMGTIRTSWGSAQCPLQPAGGLKDLPGFTSAMESLAEATDAEDAISRHTAAFARVLIAHPEIPPIPLVHTITATTAVQNLLPYVPRELCGK